MVSLTYQSVATPEIARSVSGATEQQIIPEPEIASASPESRGKEFPMLFVRTCKVTRFCAVLSCIAISTMVTATAIGQSAPATQTTVGPQMAASSSLVPPVFLPPMTYESGGILAYSVAVADLDRDGRPDLIVINQNSSFGSIYGNVALFPGNGDGTFQPPSVYGTNGVLSANVAVEDLNGDSAPDIVITNMDGSLSILMDTGDGTFWAPQKYSSGGGHGGPVIVADVNGDGKPDLVIGDIGGISVLLGNDDGSFQPKVSYFAGGGISVSLAAADVNRDGKLDIVSTNDVSTTGVLLGNGDGTFQYPIIYSYPQPFARSEALADVDGNGTLDLIVVLQCTNGMCSDGSSLAVLLGNGNGTFQPAVLYSIAGKFAMSVAVADVNGDREPDVIVASLCEVLSNCTGMLSILLGNGDGTFAASLTLHSGGAFSDSVVAADLTGNGKPDLVVTNGGSHIGSQIGSVSILLNNTLVDRTPPAITVATASKLIWPPNGRMVPVTISGTITDTGSGVNANSTSFTVNDQYGRICPHAAIILGPGGAYSFNVLLEASRLGSDLNGRHYTITVSARDNAGNASSNSVTVTIPHDER